MAHHAVIGTRRTGSRLHACGCALRIPLIRAIARLLPVLALGACTALPLQHFSTYRDTFSKAQSAGEDVLLDYAAARATLTGIDAGRAASRPAEPERLTRIPPTPPGAQAIDHITVRLRAWNVVARFNDALLAVAEGRDTPHVAGAADALLHSLNTFPLEAVRDVGADVIPFAGAIAAVLTAAERELSRRAFLQTLAKYGPVVREQFIGLLKQDVDDFYRMRFLLNDREYQTIATRDITGAMRRFNDLAQRFQYTADVQAIAKSIAASLATLPASQEKTTAVAQLGAATAALAKAPDGAPAPDPLTLDRLQRARDDVSSAVERAVAKNEALGPYAELLSSYRVLLDRTARSLKALEDAAVGGSRREPPSDELLNAVVLVRQSYLKYRDHR